MSASRQDFARLFPNVSRETLDALQVYHDLLVKWQRAVNLVSPKTLNEAWLRHFADSAQVASYIPQGAKTLYDLGSGAGFPGAVLAIMRPDLEVSLVESDEKKAQFLRSVSRETSAAFAVVNERIEAAAVHLPAPDVISARALASLDKLCAYIKPWTSANPALEALFLKGGRAAEEIDEARVNHGFEYDLHPSLSADEGSILHLKNIR